MRNLFFTILFLGIGTLSAMAQAAGDFRLNAGLALGTEAGFNGSGLGINIGGEYLFTENFSASPSFTYFFESSETVLGDEYSVRLSSFNIDGRYYFTSGPLQVYGIAGIAVLSITTEIPPIVVSGGGAFISTGGGKVSTSETGINFGGGLVYMMTDKLGLNGQLKYQTPGDGQAVLNGGITYKLN